MLDNINFYIKICVLYCAWLILCIAAPLFAGLLIIFFSFDYINYGPFSIYYDIEWRYKKWKTHEEEHDWGEWIMIEGGMRQIRFCKNCGKIDIR